MRIRSGVYWSKGAGHGKNQDSLSLQHVLLRTGECLFAIVCDGIGSLPYSEEASGYAVRRMTDWFYHEGKELICRGRSKELILLALQKQCCRMQEELVWPGSHGAVGSQQGARVGWRWVQTVEISS